MAIPPKVPIIPPMIRPTIDAELEPGELLVWLAQPRLGSSSVHDVVPVVFGLVFLLFTAFIGRGLLGSLDPQPQWKDLLPLLVLVPFAMFGFLMLLMPVLRRRGAASTYYAITNRRAIIWLPRRGGKHDVQSFQPERLVRMTRDERPDGSGHLVFEEFTTARGSGTTTSQCGFFALPDVREAEDVLRQTLLNRSANPGQK